MRLGFVDRLALGAVQGNRKTRLMAVVAVVLGAAFVVTAVLAYAVSRQRMLDLIVSAELPLTSDNVYSEIQRDLLKPIQASTLMATDTFLRDWALNGETDLGAIKKYLAEIQKNYNAFTVFFVSDLTHHYYIPSGLFKTMSHQDPHDVWFWPLETAGGDYVLDVDTDQAHGLQLTVFINARVFDYDGHFIGVCGMGLNVAAIRQSIDRYERQFGRTIYFIDDHGQVMMSGDQTPGFTDITKAPGLSVLSPAILKGQEGAMDYVDAEGQTHLLNVRYIPELHWYLMVERVEQIALQDIRRTLYLNLMIAAVATALVALLLGTIVTRFHDELDRFATTDGLTGLTNRRACELLLRQAVKEARRATGKLSLVMFDIDHFKRVNDQFGHQMGDRVIKAVADAISARRRASDVACRWGGEEMLLVLRDCALPEAVNIAEGIRREIEGGVVKTPEQPVQVTISAGVVEIGPEEGEEAALSRADARLYAAKNAGRNQVAGG